MVAAAVGVLGPIGEKIAADRIAAGCDWLEDSEDMIDAKTTSAEVGEVDSERKDDEAFLMAGG